MNRPIIVTALFGNDDQSWFDLQRTSHFPVGRNLVAAHLTMFHHLPPSLEAEIRQRLGKAAGEGRPRARIAGLMSLGGGVAYRIDSPELEDRRASLADLWSGLLTPQDRAAWRPHVTVQNKVAPADAHALLGRLRHDFRPRPVMIAGFASWRYRDGRWEKLSRHLCA